MPGLLLTLAFVCCFCLATWIEPWYQTWSAKAGRSASVLNILMGDSRKLFATHFFVKADVYFHSGYYPTIFDRPKSGKSSEMTSHADHHDKDEHHNEKTQPGEKDEHHEYSSEGLDFLDVPKDWIERFGRHFFPVEHTHLGKNGDEREILPWLKISAELDPQRIETYVTAGYWLHHRLGKPDEAEQFLREGLRANPDSYEILSELGEVYFENKNEPDVARNLWELALQKWNRQKNSDAKPNDFAHEQILVQLVKLEEQEQNLPQLLFYLEELKKIAFDTKMIDQEIQEVRARLAQKN
jgi:tetratricopeptide (TPR) repeat protein